MDCTDIKTLLSGLIDDQVDAETRYDAERHLAQCKQCRKLLDEAESLDELIRADVEDLASDRLPEGFTGAVLSRTVYAMRTTRYFRQWTTWAGWMAAAACLALAVIIWVSDRRPTSPLRAAGGDTGTPAGVIPVTYDTGRQLRSLALDAGAMPDQVPGQTAPDAARDGGYWDMQTDAYPSGDWGEAYGLTARDVHALNLAGDLLFILEDWQPGYPEDIEHIRAATEYDDLLPRLREVGERLDPVQRLRVETAEAVLARVAVTSDENDLRQLSRLVASADLSDAMKLISSRWDVRDPL